MQAILLCQPQCLWDKHMGYWAEPHHPMHSIQTYVFCCAHADQIKKYLAESKWGTASAGARQMRVTTIVRSVKFKQESNKQKQYSFPPS